MYKYTYVYSCKFLLEFLKWILLNFDHVSNQILNFFITFLKIHKGFILILYLWSNKGFFLFQMILNCLLQLRYNITENTVIFVLIVFVAILSKEIQRKIIFCVFLQTFAFFFFFPSGVFQYYHCISTSLNYFYFIYSNTTVLQ